MGYDNISWRLHDLHPKIWTVVRLVTPKPPGLMPMDEVREWENYEKEQWKLEKDGSKADGGWREERKFSCTSAVKNFTHNKPGVYVGGDSSSSSSSIFLKKTSITSILGLAEVAHNLGVVFNSTMTLTGQVKSICKLSYVHSSHIQSWTCIARLGASPISFIEETVYKHAFASSLQT